MNSEEPKDGEKEEKDLDYYTLHPDFPISLAEYEALEEIEEEIGEELGSYPKGFTETGFYIENNHVQSLNLEDIFLPTLSVGVTKLKYLKKLGLYNLEGLTSFEGLSKLINLDRLDIGGFDLDTIPREIAQHPTLKTVYFEGKNLRKMSKYPDLQLYNGEYLKKDDVMTLRAVVEEIIQIYKRSKISTNSVSSQHEFNQSIASYRKSKIPHAYATGISGLENLDVPNCLDQIFGYDDFRGNVHKLCLNGQMLTEIPLSIFKFYKLWNLYLNVNKIKVIPSEIGNLKDIHILELNSNELASIPSNIGELINLARFEVSNNNLSALPVEIGSLTKLTWMDVSNNNLTSLPKTCKNLMKLFVLNLSGNKLTRIPDWVRNVPTLKRLALNNNEISELPKWIGDLTELKTLELNNNHISHLPKSIGNLTNLRTLKLNNNCLTSIPKEIQNLKKILFLEIKSNPLIE